LLHVAEMKKRVPTRAKKKSPQKKTTVLGRRHGPAQRLLVARKLLSAAHGATLEELCAHLACSRHTAMRAVAALEEMGEALREEQEGRRIRYHVDTGSKAKERKLSTAHVLSLAVAQQAIEFLEGTSLKESFDELVELLESQLDARAFAELARIREKIVVVQDAPWTPLDRADVVDALVTGLMRGERVTLRGKKEGGGERSFDFEPYSLVVWKKGLYVPGYSHHHKALRLFALDRLIDGEWKRGDTFEVPTSWNAKERYAGSFCLFDEPETTVRIEFAPKVARYVTRRKWMPDQVLEEHAGGRVVLTMTVRGTRDVLPWVLGFGEHAVVLEPASLRDEMAVVTRKMAAAYASPE
jgi:predicted DNA-binding transcriptional regulator YafY